MSRCSHARLAFILPARCRLYCGGVNAPPAHLPAAQAQRHPAVLQGPEIPAAEGNPDPESRRIHAAQRHEDLSAGKPRTARWSAALALVRTGNLFDPADKVGLATITGALIRSGGTAAKTGDQIDEELENIAASVESQIGESYGSVSFSTLKERTDEVLGVFHDVLTGPAFREDKTRSHQNADCAAASRAATTTRTASPSANSPALIYGPKTPYGWQMEYATLDNIKRDDVVAFYKRYYFPANIILAVQGDFSAPEMKAKLEKLFAAWNDQQPPVPPFPKVDTNSPSPASISPSRPTSRRPTSSSAIWAAN